MYSIVSVNNDRKLLNLRFPISETSSYIIIKVISHENAVFTTKLVVSLTFIESVNSYATQTKSIKTFFYVFTYGDHKYIASHNKL